MHFSAVTCRCQTKPTLATHSGWILLPASYFGSAVSFAFWQPCSRPCTSVGQKIHATLTTPWYPCPCSLPQDQQLNQKVSTFTQLSIHCKRWLARHQKEMCRPLRTLFRWSKTWVTSPFCWKNSADFEYHYYHLACWKLLLDVSLNNSRMTINILKYLCFISCINIKYPSTSIMG